MNNTKRKSAVILLVLVMLFLTACSTTSIKTGTGDDGPKPVLPAVSAADSIPEDTAECFKLDDGRTYAVGIVKYTDMPDGWRYDGSGVEEFPKTGLKSWAFECEVPYYYNYPRLRVAAESFDPNARYVYFSMGRDRKWLSKSVIEEYSSRCGESPYTGENIDKEEYLQKYFSEYASTHFETELLYEFHVDWEYRQEIQVGDIVLIAVDPQLSVNTNRGIHDPYRFHAVVSPFAVDHPQPHIAKFVDGKLQLPAELRDAFTLRRLYDDTEPQLTGIKDGDSVEDVIAFLKAVEQDMTRYKEEQKQQPRTTDVSSIR